MGEKCNWYRRGKRELKVEDYLFAVSLQAASTHWFSGSASHLALLWFTQESAWLHSEVMPQCSVIEGDCFRLLD